MLLLLHLTSLLLLVSSSRKTGSSLKSVLTLNPPWVNMLWNDSLTLSCKGHLSSGNSSAMWFHNGKLIPVQTPTYNITSASRKDNGTYQCQMAPSHLSETLNLEVIQGWLLLQVKSMVFTVGDPMVLRCHSWRNQPLYKITFYHNNNTLKYFYENNEYSVIHVKHNDSGSYHCTGFIKKTGYRSTDVVITIQDPDPDSPQFYSTIWYHWPFYLVILFLFVVDTVLYIMLQRKISSLKEKRKNPVISWHKGIDDSSSCRTIEV